jgi:hypothetical protein
MSCPGEGGERGIMIFEREDTPTIMDGMVVRWYGKVYYANKPEISASRNGVCISGVWDQVREVESIKAQLDEAFKVHLQLKAQR